MRARCAGGGNGATREAFLPGDARFGDELSTAGDHLSQVLARHLVEVGAEQPSATRELSLGALQVWQAISESVGRGVGVEEVAILFTDLVGFSSWALEVGDELALELLREVASVVEPVIEAHQGRIVKRLGDGHMAVFPDAQRAVDAASRPNTSSPRSMWTATALCCEWACILGGRASSAPTTLASTSTLPLA